MGLEYILLTFQVFCDCHFHQKLDFRNIVFSQILSQEVVEVKCCLNHLRKKYGVLNNNGSVRKKCLVDSSSRGHVQTGLMQFPRLCLNLCLLK